MASFTRTLEEKARQLAGGSHDRYWDTSIPAAIRRELGLSLDHIRRQKQLHERQLRRLLRIECYTGTDLMQLERRIPRYTPHHFPEKEKLKKRLFEIEKERSAVSRLKIWIKGLQFDSGFFDGELPIDALLFFVAGVGPSRRFGTEHFDVFDPTTRNGLPGH